jgi:hypothetical protein
MASAEQAATYLGRYIQEYRRGYDLMTQAPPDGSGYPDLGTSPYLRAESLVAYIAKDGAVIADYEREPPGRWDVAGGPTLLVDYEPTRTPAWVTDELTRQGALGKNIGIYRIVARDPLDDAVWSGWVPVTAETATTRIGSTRVEVGAVDLPVTELVARLTFGAFGPILHLKFPGEEADFWQPHIIRDLGFATADRERRRFFHYLEILHHSDIAAWDPRSTPFRAHVDVRRDFAASISVGAGGTIQVPRGQESTGAVVPHFSPFEAIANQVLSVSLALDGFRTLVAADRPEAEYQEYLQEHPELLDAYGVRFHARPRFRYPEERRSPVGKTYVEPDFVIEYTGQRYTLVELERPSTQLGTERGQPSAAATAPAFQLAEWRSFIREFPSVVEELFPGLPHSYKTMAVMSRSTGQRPDRDPIRYRQLVADTHNFDDLYYYDELVERTDVALARLAALGESG